MNLKRIDGEVLEKPESRYPKNFRDWPAPMQQRYRRFAVSGASGSEAFSNERLESRAARTQAQGSEKISW